eukprot:GHVS01050202.1.p1 GENE.GHVS01050202.1~~GHVS01050202.1.p1  ORF type:complete len:373 (-),score=24.26 GHVS01050202.1:288-1406(-)
MDNVGISSVVMMFLLPLLAVLVLNASAEKLRQEQPFLALPRKLGDSDGDSKYEWEPILPSVPNICRTVNGKGEKLPRSLVPWQISIKSGIKIVACGVPQMDDSKYEEHTNFIMKKNGDMHLVDDSVIQFKLCDDLPWYFYGSKDWLAGAENSDGWNFMVTNGLVLKMHVLFMSQDKFPSTHDVAGNNGILILPNGLSLPTLLAGLEFEENVTWRYQGVIMRTDGTRLPYNEDVGEWVEMKLQAFGKTEKTPESVNVADGIYSSWIIMTNETMKKSESGKWKISVCYSMEDERKFFYQFELLVLPGDEEELVAGHISLLVSGQRLPSQNVRNGFVQKLVIGSCVLKRKHHTIFNSPTYIAITVPPPDDSGQRL